VHAYAVGGGGTIVERVPQLSSWQLMDTDFDTPLYAVCVGPSETVYAAGAGGTLLRLNDGEWVQETSPTSEDLLGFSRTSDGALIAVGGSDALSGMAILLAPE
jgi:hypothetical protein